MEKALDSTLALSQFNRELPNDLVCKDLGITRIGNLADAPVVRNVDLSYNPLSSLSGIDQFQQLRQLVAYSCRIQKMDALSATKKIEKLHLQQNNISEFFEGFKLFTKLKELRLDRNKLTKIEHLNKCLTLRQLDLSYNQITSTEGLSGLQNLMELKINNNAIRSLRHLKGLPNLRELHCAYNSLKSLDGIQFLPLLEVVHAEHNQIVTLQLGTDKDEKSGLVNRQTSSSNEAPQSVHANRLSEMTVALKEGRTNASSSLSRSNSKTGAGKAASASNGAGTSEQKRLSLTELHLRGNRLKSIEGLVQYGEAVELLDISNNDITALSGTIKSQLSHLRNMTELRIEGNPLLLGSKSVQSNDSVEELLNGIASVCPSLQHVDTSAVIGGSVVLTARGGSVAEVASKSDDPSLRLIRSIEEQLNLDEPSVQSYLNADGTLTHTWPHRGGEGSTVFDEPEKAEGEYLSSDEEAEEGAKQNKTTSEQKIELCVDETMLTEEQIGEIESVFTSLLQQCRAKLADLPRPPVKEDSAIEGAELSSMYNNLGGYVGGIGEGANAVTDQGRRVSKNLLVKSENLNVLSPTKTPKRHRAKVDISEGVSRAGGVTYAGDSSPVKTSASSLVTNVIMHINDPDTAGDRLSGGIMRSSSLRDINVDAFSMKEPIEDMR